MKRLFNSIRKLILNYRARKLNVIKYFPRTLIHKTYLVTLRENEFERLQERELILYYNNDNIISFLDNCFRTLIQLNHRETRLFYIKNIIIPKIESISIVNLSCLINNTFKKYLDSLTLELNNLDLNNILSKYPFYLKNFKMKVYCFSLLEFIKLRDAYFNDLSKINGNTAIISIVNPIDEEYGDDWTTKHPINFSEDRSTPSICDSVLNIQFKDDSEDFDPSLAKKVVNFIENNIGKDFYVHCIMGKSRSQAICRYILDTYPDLYQYGREYENPLKTANPHVLSTLKRVKMYENLFPPTND